MKVKLQHRVRYASMLAIKHRKPLIWAIVSVSTLILGTIWVNLSASSSLDDKRALVVQEMSNINTLVGRVYVEDDNETARKQLSETSSEIYLLTIKLGEVELITSTIAERFFHSAKSNTLDDLVSNIEDYNTQISKKVSMLNDKLESISKFLNYSAKEDFSLYGQDPLQDDERIQRTKQALLDIESSEALTPEEIAGIKDSLMKLSQISDQESLQIYIDSIESTQEIMLFQLKNDINSLKSEFNDFYNSLLYQ